MIKDRILGDYRLMRERVEDTLNLGGVFYLVWRILKFIFSPIYYYEVFYLYQKKLDEAFIPIEPRVVNWELHTLECPEDLDRLVKEGYSFKAYPDLHKQRKWLREKETIFFLSVGKNLVARTRILSKGKMFPQPYRGEEGVARIRTADTLKEFRRLGIQSYLHTCAFAYKKSKGDLLVTALVHDRNIAGKAIWEHFGGSYQVVRLRRIFGKNYWNWGQPLPAKAGSLSLPS